MARKRYKQITVAIDDDANECLYVDGKAWDAKGEITVYAADIGAVAGSDPIRFQHVHVDKNPADDWPDDFADLTRSESVA